MYCRHKMIYHRFSLAVGNWKGLEKQSYLLFRVKIWLVTELCIKKQNLLPFKVFDNFQFSIFTEWRRRRRRQGSRRRTYWRWRLSERGNLEWCHRRGWRRRRGGGRSFCRRKWRLCRPGSGIFSRVWFRGRREKYSDSKSTTISTRNDGSNAVKIFWRQSRSRRLK